MAYQEELAPFDSAALADLYAALSAPGGVTVAELRSRLADFRARPIADTDIQRYREGRKPWKKLHDEVVPIERLLTANCPDDARVQFPLDDQPPDAWLTPSSGAEPIGVEVTGAVARAGIEVGKSLADADVVPGFIGLPDDAPSSAFAQARRRGRITHSRQGVDRVIDLSIEARMAGKDDGKFEGHILLITAPLGSSPNRSDEDLRGRHEARAAALPFAEVFVLDPTGRGSIVQLK